MRSPHYRKKYGACARRSLQILSCLLLSQTATAVERTLWLHEGLSQTFEPTGLAERRFQAMASANSHRDAFTLRTAAQADVRLVEIGVHASRLFSLGIGQASPALHTAVLPLETVLGVELARHYRSESGYFGRLGVGYVHAFPSRSVGVRIQVDTGLVANQKLPWNFRLKLGVLIPVQGGEVLFNGRVETLHSVTPGERTGFEWGGALGLGYRFYSTVLPIGHHEKVLLSMGPVARWRTGNTGVITASALWRVWLDEEVITSATGPVHTTPAETNPLPDFQVAWALPF